MQAAKRAKLTESERLAIVDHLARNPDDGIALGNGLFKMRVARDGGGKSGGYRTIHFYRASRPEVFLLTVYAKEKKEALTRNEEADMIRAAGDITKDGGRDG